MSLVTDPASASAAEGRSKRVVVIGAGLAGLCAAYELRAKGCDVQVVEATHRAGGRVRTLRGRFFTGLYADAGAMVFGDAEIRVAHYVQRFNLPIRLVPPSTTIYHLRGQTFRSGQGWPANIALTPDERKLTPAGLLNKYFVEGLTGLAQDPLTPSWPPDSLKPFDNMSAAAFLQSRGASQAAIEIFDIGLLGLTGDGLAQVSALSVLAVVSLFDRTRLAFWIAGGSDLLPHAFAATMPARIHLGTRVTSIQATDAGVCVDTIRGGATPKTYAADYVVCTIPFSALKDVTIRPLSPIKRRIIAELPSAAVVRTFLQFREQFWTEDGLSGGANTDLSTGSVFSAYPLADSRGILETYAVGDKARALGALTPEARLQAALSSVMSLFPGAADHFESGVTVSWDQVEFAAGAYAWYKPGQLLEFLPALAAPEGRIFFAGDGTTPLPGWCDGALSSGQQAAAAILAAP